MNADEREEISAAPGFANMDGDNAVRATSRDRLPERSRIFSTDNTCTLVALRLVI